MKPRERRPDPAAAPVIGIARGLALSIVIWLAVAILLVEATS